MDIDVAFSTTLDCGSCSFLSPSVAVSMTSKICWLVGTKDSLAQERFGFFLVLL